LQFAYKPTLVKDRVMPETTEPVAGGEIPAVVGTPQTPAPIVNPGGGPGTASPAIPGSVPPENIPALGQ
jgi:hypothetical protein